MMLQLYIMILAIAFIADAQLQRRPFGPKMCQQLCNEFGGCKNITYDDSLLRCVLIISGNPVNHNVRRRQEGGQRSCKNHWRMIELRRKTNKCLESPVRMLPISSHDEDWIAHDRKLLVVPYLGDPTYITEIHLNDYSKRWFPYFVSKMKSVLYLTSSKSFIISRDVIGQVISFDPVSNKTTLFFRRSLVFFMVCDERRKIVFYVGSRSKGNRLGRFSTNGLSHRVLTKLPCHATSAAINEEKQQIYLSLMRKSKIVSLNYDGKAMSTLKASVYSMFLYYDKKSHLLYFQNNQLHVYNLDVNDMKISKVVRLACFIRSGVILGKNLYYSSVAVKKVHVVDLHTYNVTILKLEYTVYHFSTLLLI